jgi:phenylacetaldehyde dehydrogenase
MSRLLQVVAAANDNPYGLASGVLAKDQAVIDGLVRRIKAGTVWVNTYNVYDAGEGKSRLAATCSADVLLQSLATRSIY